MATSAFCNLKPEELLLLNQYKTSHRVKKKQTLFYEGETVKGLHCVHEGKVKLYKTLNDGNVQILRIAKGSDLIGYRGLLGDGKYIATAETIEESVICFIPRERIFEFIVNNLKFSLGLMSQIATDISNAENKAINFLQKSSRERLAEALLLMEHSFGTLPDGSIDIRLTREEIAALTGMAVETTIRTLHAWENDKIIALDKKSIRILDHRRLLDISNTED
jgi:CRP-like cAMP-binding protein